VSSLLAILCSLAASLIAIAALAVAWRTARSTRLAVVQMRETSFLTVRPALQLEQTSTAWFVDWDRSQASFPALVARGGMDSANGIFRLTNAAAPPAFAIKIDWTLDPDAALAPDFRSAAIGLANDQQKVDLTYAEGVIQVRDRDWRSAFLDFDYRHALHDTSALVQLQGNATQYLGPAEEVEHQIALLALETFEARQIRNQGFEPRKIGLSIKVQSTSLAGEITSQVQQLSVEVDQALARGPDQRIQSSGSLSPDWARIEITLKVTPMPAAS
jgi:hypothetical protein